MSKEDTGGGGIMDINKCADCYTVYCSFSESDRQKLEMFDEIVNQLSILYYGYEGINYTLKPLLFRAKKLQEERG